MKVKEHPEGEELEEFIRKFGRDNKHLARGKHKQAAWFVSHCATQVLSSHLRRDRKGMPFYEVWITSIMVALMHWHRIVDFD